MCFPYHYSNLTAIEGYPICLMMTSCNQSFNIIHITRLNLDQIPFIVILFPTCTCLVWVRHSIDLNVKLCKFYVWKVNGLRGFNYVHWWTQPSFAKKLTIPCFPGGFVQDFFQIYFAVPVLQRLLPQSAYTIFNRGRATLE